MHVISHRGMWSTPAEGNTLAAFTRSFEAGFGVEVDVRDRAGELVVSHDPPRGNEPRFAELVELHRTRKPPPLLAINVKSDGLAAALAQELAATDAAQYFMFDMSIPDTLPYICSGMPVFTRVSEYEAAPPPFRESIEGVWLDAFRSEWFTEDDVLVHLDAGMRVCLVSPELHAREHRRAWETWRTWSCAAHGDLLLCTDLPEDASEVFGQP